MFLSGGIILGLSTGAVCLAYCGPVLFPFLLGEGAKVVTNGVFVLLFLLGRLFAYLIVGGLAGIVGVRLFQFPDGHAIAIGLIYILLATLLILYGLYRFKEVCLGKAGKNILPGIWKNFPYLVPLAGGVITGLNLCPPFLLAFTQAAQTGSILHSLIFFLWFFIGTSLYFIPLPFIGFFRRREVLRIVGKFAAILAGIFYLYQGIFMLLK
jgi:sulfite exporter TauE/SafE